MNTKEPTAVLIHGHHLQAPEWETLVWGTNRLAQVGRIPRGVETAVKEDAEVIIWGTGASEDLETGKKESEFTYAYALEHIDELAMYVDLDKNALESLLEHKSEIQLNTKNTKDEVYEAMRFCKEKGIHTLYLVSTPTHVPRCLLFACQFQEEFPGMVLHGVAAESTTDFWHPRDVAVIEPSHRPDRSEVPMNLLAKRMASARKHTNLALALYDDLKKRLDEFDEEIEKRT